MKLLIIALLILAFPVITGIAEWHESDEQAVKRDILRMADGDRRTQAVRRPNRRMAYAAIGKKNPRRRGNANQGQKKNNHLHYIYFH